MFPKLWSDVEGLPRRFRQDRLARQPLPYLDSVSRTLHGKIDDVQELKRVTIAAGRTVPEPLADFPYLQEQDIREALCYAASLAQGRDVRLAS